VWEGTLTESELRDRVAAVAGGHTDRVVETYRRAYPGKSPAERLIATLTDCNFRIRSLTMAERRARKSRAATYMYLFAWETPAFGGRLKSPHAMDVPFTFETVHLLASTDRNEQALVLAGQMAGTWAAFARTGKPGHAGIPHWPAYTAERRATLILDENCRVENDPGGETRALWQEIARS
jgi:para-nitrobenzyl esterase